MEGTEDDVAPAPVDFSTVQQSFRDYDCQPLVVGTFGKAVAAQLPEPVSSDLRVPSVLRDASNHTLFRLLRNDAVSSLFFSVFCSDHFFFSVP